MIAAGDRCYPCGGVLEGRDICRLCGARREINRSTGNVIWVRNGLLVAAFEDERQAYIAMAQRNKIPVERWPAKYRPEGD